jgi:uncharacterized protein with GYD domain
MAKYLIQASYTQQGLQGLLKEGGTSRRSTVEKLANGLGGNIDAFYYAFGDNDVYAIADMPDNATATAVALTIGATGAVSLKTTVLITPETVDEAVKKTVDYRVPGA